jgi:hypothetical protein
MGIEQSLERQAVALEKIAEELKLIRETASLSNVKGYFENVGKEEAKAETPTQPEVKKAPAKKAPAAKVEVAKEPVESPLQNFDPAKEFVAEVKPAVVAPVKEEVKAPSGPTTKDVIASLEQYSKDFGEDQAYNLLISFKVAKVSDLTEQQRKDLLDKVAKLRSLNL